MEQHLALLALHRRQLQTAVNKGVVFLHLLQLINVENCQNDAQKQNHGHYVYEVARRFYSIPGAVCLLFILEKTIKTSLKKKIQSQHIYIYIVIGCTVNKTGTILISKIYR